MKKTIAVISSLILSISILHAQEFTHADTLRGSNGPGRSWWNATKYDLHVDFDLQDSTLLISVDLKGKVQDANLDVALVQKKAVTSVGDGENRGVTLTDFNVVRYFQTIENIKTGENNLSLNIPPSLKPGNRQMILYIQEKAGNKITGAIKKDF